MKKEPLQPQPMPTEPDTLIAFSPSMGVQIGALLAVLVLSCWALVLIKKHCCGQREHRHPTSLSNRADYFPGSNNCEVGNALVDEGAGVNGKSLFDFDDALAPLLLRPVSPINVKRNGHVLDWASSKSLSSMLTGSSSRSRLDDSVGYALLPADWSLASSSAPPLEPLVSDHHSSFDSGIDRRSVTPPIASSRTTPVLAPTKK